jgi:hypothetical protein
VVFINLKNLFWCLTILCFLQGIVSAISVNLESSGVEDKAVVAGICSLNDLTAMNGQFILNSGSVQGRFSLSCSGSNSIKHTFSNLEETTSSSISSLGAINLAASSSTSGKSIELDQTINALGESHFVTSSLSDAGSLSLIGGVSKGVLASTQSFSTHEGSHAAEQATDIVGMLGYTEASSKSGSDSAKVSVGLNGYGEMSSRIDASTYGDANALGDFQAGSITSKAYTSSEATSKEAKVFTYLSSGGMLNSKVDANSNEHVSTSQKVDADEDVLIYASTSDAYSSKSQANEASKVSGSISAEAGSPQIINSYFEGEVQSTSLGLAPTPGHYVWQGFGGFVTSNPSLIKDDQGRSHAFMRATGDYGLWDNINGNWYSMQGAIKSDPFAVRDYQGRLHVLVVGLDNNLWDRVMDTATLNSYWLGPWGGITSDPTAAVEPVANGFLKIAARGNDGVLWMRDVDTRTMAGVWNQIGAGGVIASDPYVVFDAQTNVHTFVRGLDGRLWDNIGIWNGNRYVHSWRYLGTPITSDAKPIQDPNNLNYLHIFARGASGELVDTRLNTANNAVTPLNFGNYIAAASPGGFRSTIFDGNPDSVVDPTGLTHTFIRGSNGALWDHVFDTTTNTFSWYDSGAIIASDPDAMLAANGQIKVGVKGLDNAFWTQTIY